jgi:hypothetical protein
MRKIIHTFIAAVLLVSTTGMTINLHFCHEHLYDIGLNQPAERCCDNGLNDHKCHTGFSADSPEHCLDESIEIIITDDYLAAYKQSFAPADPDEDLFTQAHSTFSLDLSYKNSNIVSIPDYYIPPPPQKSLLSKIQSYRL